MEADLLILGAGIAGLRCGIEILHKRPHTTVVILEKYNYTGGRVVTYKKTLKDIQGKCKNLLWEIGAGRIHTTHTKVLDLFKQYKLTTQPLSTEQYYIEKGIAVDNSFESLLELFAFSIQQMKPEFLANHTLREIFQTILHDRTEDFLSMFPYRAEVDTLRADMGIESFHREMGTYEGYVVVKEGLSAMIDGMVKEFQQLGGQLFLQQTVTDIQKDSDSGSGSYLVQTKTQNGPVLWKGKKVICALHSEALKQIPCFAKWKTLQHLQMEPLVRVYAVFPAKNGKSWFSDIGRSVSPGPIRYFIPINSACGVVMMSYTDGKDARRVEHILKIRGEKGLQQFLMRALRKMFPNHDIPEPIFFKPHPWYEGCTYWLPGSYDPHKLSIEALQPFPQSMPGLYCCGESFSTRQAWMEGALEHADELLKRHF